MILISMIIICILFGIYAWLSGTEMGIAIVRLNARSASTKRATALFSPLWEITNVFLVFGFTAFAVLFNNGLVEISKVVLSSLVIGLVALIIRAITVLLIFYQKVPTGKNWQNSLFSLVSFIVPLSFGAAGIVLVTGEPFWHTTVGLGLFAALATGLIALAVSFACYLDKKRFENISLYANLAFMLTMLLAIYVITRNAPSTPSYYSLVRYLSTLLLIAGVGQLVIFLREAWQKMWFVLSGVALITPLFVALANRPFLMYPEVSLDGAYGAHAYGIGAIIGLLITLPLMTLGLFLLVYLLVQHPVPHR